MDEQRALEEVEFLKRIIEDSKRSVLYNGKDFIFWGILVITGMLLTYVFVQSHIYINYVIIWAVLIPVGWFFSLYNRKSLKRSYPKTFPGRIIAGIWGVNGIVMTIIGFVGPFSHLINGYAISPLLCLIMGGAYYLTGLVLESKWVRWLSIGWWLGGILLFFVTSINQFLIMIFLMLFFQTIPGIIFYMNYKQKTEAGS